MNCRTIINILMLLLLSGCVNSESNRDKKNKDYFQVLNRFNKELVNHFPRKINIETFSTYYTKKIENNDVSLIHYEYDVDLNDLKKTLEFVLKKKKAFYQSNDTCLLIINDYKEKEIDELMKDSSCIKYCNPIPRFVNIKNPVKSNPTLLNSQYCIYVLDSSPNKYFRDFQLKPNPRMPKSWKNGYSKGIAINKTERTIIYWVTIW